MIPSTMSSPRRLTDRTVCLEEGGYVFRNIHDEDDRVKAYRLRHQVFAEDLQWVPRTESELEVDAYDEPAVHFGVLDDAEKLLAYVRLLTADRTFMLEREFRCTLGSDRALQKGSATCELTRFCVEQSARGDVVRTEFGDFPLFMLLFKGLYQWSLQRGIHVIYAVTDRIVYKLLSMRGFPCERMGSPVKMPDGVIAVSMRMDWREFLSTNAIKRPDVARWFAQKSMSFLPIAIAMA